MTATGRGLNTRLVHGGHRDDPTGAVTVPIYQTSTFAFRDAAHGAALFAGTESGFIYSRLGNPTVQALEECIADLEHGCGAVATSSGMGAVSAVYLALLGQGEPEEAAEAAGEGLSIVKKAGDPSEEVMLLLTACLAKVEHALGHKEKSRALVASAEEIAQRRGLDEYSSIMNVHAAWQVLNELRAPADDAQIVARKRKVAADHRTW